MVAGAAAGAVLHQTHSTHSTPELSPSASPEPASPTTSDEEDEAPPAIVEDPHTRVAAEHVFVVGDAADAFGAINAGHNAFFQGEVAAQNILKLIKGEGEGANDARLGENHDGRVQRCEGCGVVKLYGLGEYWD